MPQDLDHPTVSHGWMIKVLGHDLLLDDQGPGTWLTVEWSRSWDMTYCWMIKVLGHDLLLNDQGSGTWLVSHVPEPWSSNSKSCPRTLIIQQQVMSQNLDHPTVSHVPEPWSFWDMTYCWMIKVLGHDLLLDDQGPGTWLTVGWSRSWDMTYCWMIKVHPTVSNVPEPWPLNSKSCPRTLIIQQ
jgi:hypothetical protein